MTTLEFKWTVSRARDSYGYNINTLYVDGKKVAACNGGGYDMRGTNLGTWVARRFEKELLTLNTEFYGLTYHDPTFNHRKTVPAETAFGGANTEGKTIEQLESEGESFGLEAYQAFYHASTKTPDEKHNVPLIDGACGFSSVERILKAIGYKLEYVPVRSQKIDIYQLVKEETEKCPTASAT